VYADNMQRDGKTTESADDGNAARWVYKSLHMGWRSYLEVES